MFSKIWQHFRVSQTLMKFFSQEKKAHGYLQNTGAGLYDTSDQLDFISTVASHKCSQREMTFWTKFFLGFTCIVLNHFILCDMCCFSHSKVPKTYKCVFDIKHLKFQNLSPAVILRLAWAFQDLFGSKKFSKIKIVVPLLECSGCLKFKSENTNLEK